MAASRSPRQRLQALCDAWGSYIALPHGRAHVKAFEDTWKKVVTLVMIDGLSRSSGPPRYKLLFGQLVVEMKALPTAALVLANTEQRIESCSCSATAAESVVILAG